MSRRPAIPAEAPGRVARLLWPPRAGPMISLGLELAVVWPAALLGVLALGAPAPAAGQEPPDGRGGGRGEAVPSLVVAGRGEVRAAPDEATVRLGVLGQAATAAAAQPQGEQRGHGGLAAGAGRRRTRRRCAWGCWPRRRPPRRRSSRRTRR